MSTDPAQSWDPQQRPWQPWRLEDSEQTWRSLGAIAHGPVVLAQAPGIVVGLRCLFAYPDQLSAWLIATADTAYIPPVLPHTARPRPACTVTCGSTGPGSPTTR